jgi:DNA-binding NarL/FixJ family response regulator
MENRVLPDQMEAGHGPDKADTDGRAIRTVVADDSPFVLKALSSFLELQHDFQLVGTATGGVHAVRRVVELEPDLVLMDLRLSGMNGLEATPKSKRAHKRRRLSWSARTTLQNPARQPARTAPMA